MFYAWVSVFAIARGSASLAHARRLKQSITIRLDGSTVAYFKGLAADTELPYQSLINLYLRDCVARRRKPSLRWRTSSVKSA